MPTLKKFLHYYKPHKAMLIFDLICATVVSLIDISFPQILNVLNKSLFTMDATVILHTIGFVAIGLIVMYLIKLFCVLSNKSLRMALSILEPIMCPHVAIKQAK